MFDFKIQNINQVDSPSLVLYEENLDHNISLMLNLVNGNGDRLMPHIKTNKMPKVIKRIINAGIKNFKAATIGEAELAAREGASSVLIAHQLVGPKLERFIDLIGQFPETEFTTIVDNINSTTTLSELAASNNLKIQVYIDINNGMNRSGIELGSDLKTLVDQIDRLNSLNLLGFHVYDGHLRDSEFDLRNEKVENQLQPVSEFFNDLQKDFPILKMICGGTPTFTSHALETERITSPGTCVLWDWGYHEKLQEQKFKFAVLLITRVISKPTQGIVTIDLGHKSVAPENPIDKRVKFLNIDDSELISQSEEHGVLKVRDWQSFKVGDVLYGIPYHICPTINLHEYVSVVSDSEVIDKWKICRTR